MKFSAEIKGVDSLLKKLARVPKNVDKSVFDALAAGTLKIHGDAIKSIQAQQSKSRKEVRYDPTRIVDVSAPGHPPNSDTGRLVKSIGFDLDSQKLAGRVGTNLKYGAWLEFGTQTMAPRPWLSPAFRRNLEEIKDQIAEAFAEGIIK